MIVACKTCGAPASVARVEDFECPTCGATAAVEGLQHGVRPPVLDAAIRAQLGSAPLLMLKLDAPLLGLPITASEADPALVVVLLDAAAEAWSAYAVKPDWIELEGDDIVGMDRVTGEGTPVPEAVAMRLFPFLNPIRYKLVG